MFMDSSKLQISFHGLDHSDALEDKIKDKSSHIVEKYGHLITRFEWTLESANPKESAGKELFRAKVHLHMKQKRELHVQSEKEDAFSAVSDLARKLQQRIEKSMH